MQFSIVALLVGALAASAAAAPSERASRGNPIVTQDPTPVCPHKRCLHDRDCNDKNPVFTEILVKGQKTQRKCGTCDAKEKLCKVA